MSSKQFDGSAATLRHDWTSAEVNALFDLPFHDLLLQAHLTHRQCFDPGEMQVSTLLSIKTGGCAEDCKYCPQSAQFTTDIKAGKLMATDAVIASAKAARASGASRFCMGAAWRNPKERDMPQLLEMVRAVKDEGLETCMTLGMLTPEQADALKEAGLDYYNHNLDTSENFYKEIITTRTYADRLETLDHVRASGMKVCCGGIMGMGEAREDRAELLRTLATLSTHPESVPVNRLVTVTGTPLENAKQLDDIEFVRTIAIARILMPRSYVRLSAGRENMSDSLQTLCYFAGANSIFYGEKLLTTPNPDTDEDKDLLARLGMVMQTTNPAAESTPA